MSRHALEQARERGISINEIKETIQYGSKFAQEDKIVAIHRHIKIVFRWANNVAFIITVMIKKPEDGK